MKIKKILLNNLALKSLALLLAFVTWLYVGEATKIDSDKTVLQRLMPSSSYITKKLYVKPLFVGEIPEGYKLASDQIQVDPEYIVVVGPSGILSRKEFIYTQPIDIGEYTKEKMISIGLESISRSIKFPQTEVQIFLPIQSVTEQ